MIGLNLFFLKLALTTFSTMGISTDVIVEKIKNLVQENQNAIVDKAVKNNNFETLLTTEGLTVGPKQQENLMKVLESKIKNLQDRAEFGALSRKDLIKIAGGILIEVFVIYSGFYSEKYLKKCDSNLINIDSEITPKFIGKLSLACHSLAAVFGYKLLHNGVTKKASKQDLANTIATLESLKQIKVP